MQNFALLEGGGKKPSASDAEARLQRLTVNDLLMSAEHILSEGNPNVLLCERGIRTFETMTRETRST